MLSVTICSVVVLGWCKCLSEAGELLQEFERERETDAFFFFLMPVLPVICFILLEGSGEVTQLTDKGFGREGHQPRFSFCLCRAVLSPFLAFL